MARQGIMLANKITDRLIQQLGDEYIVQPKLNGLRGWTKWPPQHTDISPDLISSGGNKLMFFEYIEEELLRLGLETGLFKQWDGEIYEHGMAVEDIHSIARRTVNRKEGKLSYYIFDIKSAEVQAGRIVHLIHLDEFIRRLNLQHIKVVPSFLCRGDRWKMYLKDFLDRDYEGIIFRDIRGQYVERKCNQLLKYKATEKKPYRILRILQGEGWCYDRAGSILVFSESSGEFAVGSGRILTKDGRLDIWEKRADLQGKTLIVRHEKEVTQTNQGKPRGCNAWEIEGVKINY